MNKPNMDLFNVLLVEDNEGDILLTKDAFEEIGFDLNLDIAKNGKEALDYLYGKGGYAISPNPDLILLDINIPVYSGHHVLNKIKNDSGLKKTPVIILTTSQNHKDIELAYENHCNSYVVKPIDFNHFLRVIKSISEFWLELARRADT